MGAGGLSRALRIGILAAAAVAGIKLAVLLLAPEALVSMPSNYRAWGLPPGAGWEDAARFFVRGGLLAPVAEEALFRGGLQGGLILLCGLWRPLRRLEFWGPALASAVLFVVLHETANPVYILVRMIAALVLARVFYEEGLVAAAAMHGAGNAFWIALIVADAFWGPDGTAAALAALAGAFGLAWRFVRVPEGREPRAARPARCGAPAAAALAAVLIAGTWAAGGSPLYALAFLGLSAYAAARGLAHLADRALDLVHDLLKDPADLRLEHRADDHDHADDDRDHQQVLDDALPPAVRREKG